MKKNFLISALLLSSCWMNAGAFATFAPTDDSDSTRTSTPAIQTSSSSSSSSNAPVPKASERGTGDDIRFARTSQGISQILTLEECLKSKKRVQQTKETPEYDALLTQIATDSASPHFSSIDEKRAVLDRLIAQMSNATFNLLFNEVKINPSWMISLSEAESKLIVSDINGLMIGFCNDKKKTFFKSNHGHVLSFLLENAHTLLPEDGAATISNVRDLLPLALQDIQLITNRCRAISFGLQNQSLISFLKDLRDESFEVAKQAIRAGDDNGVKQSILWALKDYKGDQDFFNLAAETVRRHTGKIGFLDHLQQMLKLPQDRLQIIHNKGEVFLGDLQPHEKIPFLHHIGIHLSAAEIGALAKIYNEDASKELRGSISKELFVQKLSKMPQVTRQQIAKAWPLFHGFMERQHDSVKVELMSSLMGINDRTIDFFRQNNQSLMLPAIAFSPYAFALIDSFQSLSPEQQQRIVNHEDVFLHPTKRDHPGYMKEFLLKFKDRTIDQMDELAHHFARTPLNIGYKHAMDAMDRFFAIAPEIRLAITDHEGALFLKNGQWGRERYSGAEEQAYKNYLSLLGTLSVDQIGAFAAGHGLNDDASYLDRLKALRNKLNTDKNKS